MWKAGSRGACGGACVPVSFVRTYNSAPYLEIHLGTYVGNTAVGAPADLGLVGVDEDARVAERTSAAVARDDLLLGPAYGLLVNEVDGCQRSRLCGCQPMGSPFNPPCSSKYFPIPSLCLFPLLRHT